MRSEEPAVWQQPVLGEKLPAGALELGGLEALRLFTDARVLPPPVGYLTGLRPTEFGPGSATFVMPLSGWLVGPQGMSYGGVVAVLADAPLGCAVHTSLPAGLGYSTTELALSLVRPVPSTGTLIARARLIYSGNSTGIADAEVLDDSGRLVAHCTTRCAVFPGPIATGVAEAFPVREIAYPESSPFRQSVRGQAQPAAIWETLSGLEVLQAHISGDLAPPPIGELLGLRPVSASEGCATFVLPAHGWLAQPLGFVEGGITACLADSAMASAVQTTVDDGRAFAPVDLRVNFHRPVAPDGRDLTAVATVERRSKAMAYARADVFNADGKLVATGTSTSLYR